MRVLHVITSLDIAGAEKLMVDLLPALQTQGVEVELLLFDGKITPFYKQLQGLGVVIHVLGKGRRAYDPRHLWGMLRYVHKYDIVHTHNTPCQLYGALASLFRKTTLVTTEHSTNNRRRTKPWLRIVDKWMYSRYRAVVGVSQKVVDTLKTYVPLQGTFVETIPNGINFKVYADASPATDLQTELAGKKVLAMVARFDLAKDQPTLFRALVHLPADYVLILVGKGEREAEFRALAQQLGIANRVYFLGVRTDVPNVLAVADVVTISSHYEGFCLSALEGMASGRPVVASQIEGMQEVVSGGGILFAPYDEKSLAHILEQLCTDEAYYKEVQSSCQKRAQTYDIAHTAKSYKDLYKRLY